jgi:hypothetical protein
MRALLLATGLLCACSRPNDAAVRVGLTSEATAQRVNIPGNLLVTVRAIDLRFVHDEKVADVEHQADEAEWVTTFEGKREIDLFDAEGAEVFLAEAAVPAGTVTEVRLVLSDAVTLILPDKTIQAKCPSCGTSGLKIKPRAPLVVAPGDRLHLLLKIDLAQSVRLDDPPRLDPVIRF